MIRWTKKCTLKETNLKLALKLIACIMYNSYTIDSTGFQRVLRRSIVTDGLAQRHNPPHWGQLGGYHSGVVGEKSGHRILSKGQGCYVVLVPAGSSAHEPNLQKWWLET